MPNWCTNDLHVSGDKEQLRDFVSKSIVNDDFTLSGTYPTPAELENETAPSYYRGNEHDHESRIAFEKREKELKDRYGHTNWYDWRIQNWGTKWDTSYASVYMNDDDEFGVSFESAWAPPCRWMRTVAKMYPLLTFKLSYMEEGMCFCGVSTAKGDNFKDKEGDIQYVDPDNDRAVEWDGDQEKYRYSDTKELIDDDDFIADPVNPFE